MSNFCFYLDFFRPYIKEIAGRKRLFFLGTVSAISDSDSTQFDGSVIPDLALIDSEYRDVVWIDAKHPSVWDKLVYDQLNEAWRSSENIDFYYKDEGKLKDASEQFLDSVKEITKIDDDTKVINEWQRKIDSVKTLAKKDTVQSK